MAMCRGVRPDLPSYKEKNLLVWEKFRNVKKKLTLALISAPYKTKIRKIFIKPAWAAKWTHLSPVMKRKGKKIIKILKITKFRSKI